MNKVRIATLDEMDSSTPAHALVANVDLVCVWISPVSSPPTTMGSERSSRCRRPE
jgi:hypothetical protein